MSEPGKLVIVTGPSHVGKSTLIRELLRRAGGAGALVSIDEEIEGVGLPVAERWERGLSAAYAAAAERSLQLLREGRLVFYESTFTYVPPEGRSPEFHLEQLQLLLRGAAEADAEAVVLHLQASREEVAARQGRTGRLTQVIVEETWRQHASEALEAPLLLRLDTNELDPSELADRVTRRFEFLAPG